MIEIVKAPPHAVVQDRGFPQGRAWGLPPSGAMDPTALFAVNGFARNPPGAAAIEWALGPLVIRCAEETLLSAMPVAEVRIGSEASVTPWQLRAPRGQPVTLVLEARCRFGYLAVRGGLEVPPVLGSRSTYLPGRFGGLEGRRLRAGDRLPVGTLREVSVPDRARSIAAQLRPGAADLEDLVLRAIPGPQWDRFEAETRERFFAARFLVDRASDRNGYRLTGPAISPREAATLPSEAACPGAVQIPDNGQPIVLMPDGPTVGGYPKIAVVHRWDLARLAQLQPGAGVRFQQVRLEAVRAGLRREAEVFGTGSDPEPPLVAGGS